MHRQVILDTGDFAQYHATQTDGPNTHVTLQSWTTRSRRQSDDVSIGWVEYPPESPPNTFRLTSHGSGVEIISRTPKRHARGTF